ncbi:DnaJ family domain-containing protein [Shewanella fidelis]|uniref:DnaJ family domain-containing protein n=1 Tax=Shewanella fidelis TaxID=173509 RepID=UPI00048C3F71|nr:DnaJ family domain-containing protein [Shewanella fidelis]
MSLYVEDYISRQVQKISESGEMANNPYQGKRLELESYFRSPVENRAINRFLSDSGFVPPKIQILAEIKVLESQQEQEYSLDTQLKLNALRLKYDMSK